MRKITLLIVLLFAVFSMINAQDSVNVTLQVDLSNVSDLHEGGSVWIYMDANWNEYYDMTEASAGIYTYTTKQPVDSTFTYRFSYQNGADPNSDYVEENVPGECANGEGFRELTIPNADQTLDAVAFGSCSATANPKVNVTFKVDMSYQESASDVQVVIKNPWIWTALTDDGNGVWSATVELDGNTTYPFTYVNGGKDNWSGEESVPEDCNFGTESAPERNVVVGTEDMVLNLVAFGSCDENEPMEMISVALNVDMSKVTDMYQVTGTVWVYMDADWNEYYDMVDEDSNGVFTYVVDKPAGSTLTYKFSYQNGPDPWSNYVEETVPEACANANGFREVVLPDFDVVLDPVVYETCSDTTTITIQVDLNGVDDLYEGGAVWVYMDDNWNEYYDMTDDDADGIYTIDLIKNIGDTVEYSFSYQTGADPNSDYVTENVPAECANANGWRELIVPAYGYTTPLVAYGSCDAVSISKVAVTFSVDMSKEESASDVQVVIKDPWIWTALTEGDNGVWSATVELDPNGTYPYTFVNGGKDNWPGEEKIDGDCNFGTETAPERHVEVLEEEVVLDLVYFGKCDHVSSIGSNELANLLIYPNPANDQINVVSENESIQMIQIFDMSGKLVLSKTHINDSNVNVNIANIESGMYVIKVQGISDSNTSKLIVK